MDKQVTIKDLARLLELSPSTVSRALRDHPSIQLSTRQKVKKLADQLNYKPNQIARNLQSKSTRVIGVIIPEIVHFFFSNVISGMEEVAAQNGYTLMFCQSNENPNKEENDLQRFISRRVDGILISIASDQESPEHYQNLIEIGMPTVFFDRAPESIEAFKVIIDDLEAGKKVTNHLIRQGCESLLHISSASKLKISQDRKAGFLSVIEENRSTVKGTILEIQSHDLDEMKDQLETFISKGVKFDGVFCNNDMLALSLIKSLEKYKYQVPKDVKVIGFGDWQFSEFMQPSLSTVKQPGKQIGKKAMELLINQIKGIETKPKTEIIPAELVLRDSSKQ